MWARNAADALGEFGDARAVPALLAAYERYSKDLKGANPKDVPRDDVMGFPSEDRMLETPYAIAYALCRLPIERSEDKATLRRLAPRIMANLPGDHDTFFLYEPEVGHLLTQCLMEQTGLRQEACEVAMMQLGQPRRVPSPDESIEWSSLCALLDRESVAGRLYRTGGRAAVVGAAWARGGLGAAECGKGACVDRR